MRVCAGTCIRTLLLLAARYGPGTRTHGLWPTLQLMDGGLLPPPGRCDEAAVSIPACMSVCTRVFIFLGYSRRVLKAKVP